MKKHSSFSKSGKMSAEEAKPMRRESQDVMSELVERLRKQLVNWLWSLGIRVLLIGSARTWIG